MTILWQGLKVTFGFLLIAGLVFASGVFTMLLYAKFKGEDAFLFYQNPNMPLAAVSQTVAPLPVSTSAPTPLPIKKKPESAMIEAPAIMQHPELPAGCEITSLAMLLQFAGIEKSKMELAAEMPKDETKAVLHANGSIKYWGNPNVGFVGDVTRKGMGFGIYHAGLFPLLKSYMPTAVDLTNKSFESYEQHVADGIPIVVWTTINYKLPTKMVSWETSLGKIETTFSEHAVLLVGYDKNNVYLNDPTNGKKAFAVNKEQFIQTWEAMGKQGITYNK
ncbi:C39 family peptidase [Paenibacillus eucommiae]|uniref:Uncharacterized protein YvpB n=1 Tax=Paenibacillus eucommiae TaxID=1355755 RepID=A0ABS4J9I2_9BACL|nr:C39 family peptidase [Paenibacillus eucommiae]MBP1996498.1 uncharacterized protein YvpB [Paenibacillus eucommiae]